jgi:hypothetical protein
VSLARSSCQGSVSQQATRLKTDGTAVQHDVARTVMGNPLAAAPEHLSNARHTKTVELRPFAASNKELIE